MKGAKARVLYKAMRCHANGEVTIMLVNEIYRTLRLSILEKTLELNHTGCNGKERMQSRSSARRPLKILPQCYA
jgi:hypothetical protein